MKTLSYRSGSDALNGGIDITISLPPEEADALGLEAQLLADWFDTALWALATLRTGTNVRADASPANRDVTASTLYDVINDLDNRLLPRLQGLRDAAIRRHAELGGSLGQLATAMDVAKSTAQSRRNVVTRRDRPSRWEQWALQNNNQ